MLSSGQEDKEGVVKRLLVISIVACIGCGGGDGRSAPQKCDDLISDVCDRAVTCIPGQGTRDECVQAVHQVLACGSAKMVSTSYGRCIEQINDASCAILFPTDPQTGDVTLVLPADCNRVIVAREAGAESSSSVFAGARTLSSGFDH
jgi:hypothetical protein